MVGSRLPSAARLPVVRKSELHERQQAAPKPGGGAFDAETERLFEFHSESWIERSRLSRALVTSWMRELELLHDWRYEACTPPDTATNTRSPSASMA